MNFCLSHGFYNGYPVVVAREHSVDPSARTNSGDLGFFRREQMVPEFAEANDLIELNVVGALNSNLAFYRGMADGAADPT